MGEDDSWVLIDASNTDLGLCQLLRRTSAPCPGKAAVLRDVEPGGELEGLLLEAEELCRRSFASRLPLELLDHKHLTLLSNESQTTLVGYCLYFIVAEEEALRIEELAIVQDLRGFGFGRQLVEWLIGVAGSLGCRALTLTAREGPLPFFRRLGFEATEDWMCAGLWRAELWPASEPSGGGPGPAGAARGPPGGLGRSPPPRGLGSSSSGVQLLCFLASHVSSLERVERLSDLLASVAAQAPQGPPRLFLSWSAATPELRLAAGELLPGALAELPGHVALEQPEPLSQFQHFGACLRAAGPSAWCEGAWVFFTDDDDLWHPGRYSEYLRTICDVHEHHRITCVAATTHATASCSVMPHARSPGDVDRMLVQGAHVCRMSDVAQLCEQERLVTSARLYTGSVNAAELRWICEEAMEHRNSSRTCASLASALAWDVGQEVCSDLGFSLSSN